MLFVIYAVDKPDAFDIRLANRQAHLDYLKRFEANVVFAGPFLADVGDGMEGSLLAMEFPDRAAVEDFAANDPYRKAGLFASVAIRRWKKVLPSG